MNSRADTEVLPDAVAMPRARRLRSGPRVLLAGIGGALGLLVLLDLASSRLLGVTPDGATVLLEGHTLAGGELALRGWSLSLDSFWGVDAAFYALFVRVLGMRLGLLHLVPALLATLVVVCGVLLACEGRRGAGAWFAGGTVVALLAFPTPDLGNYLLQGPWHVGTALYCLVAFRSLASGRFDRRWLLAVVLLAIGLVSDLLILGFGVLPCLAVGLAAMLRLRSWRGGLATATAAPAAVAGAFALRALGQTVGTFALVNRNIVVRGPQVLANLSHLRSRLPPLFGVGQLSLGRFPNGPPALQALHLVGLALVAFAVLAASYALTSGVLRPRPERPPDQASWRLEDLLVAGVLADLAVFVWGSPNGHAGYVKYLTPGVIFGVVLTGRLVGRFAERIRSRALLASLATAGCLVATSYAVEFVGGLFRTPPSVPTVQLTRFLAGHHLTVGIGDYWSASLVTVGSDGAIAVRPVTTGPAARIERFDRQSSADWYRPGAFQFLVYDTARPWHGVGAASAVRTYGPPAHVYAVGSYRVLRWNRPLAVATGAVASQSPLNILWGLGAPRAG